MVNISAVQVYRQRRFVDPFSNFFGGEDAFPVQRGQSAGSGVIVGSDGYVLTNNHVLGQGALQQVTVILSDRRERPAKLVGIDPTTDLALLKIAERNLPAVTWGDSGQLKVAEWVLAVGNPYQLGQTVTLGIVSGLNRSYEDVSSIVDYIQTDAAINPGNSGGALINRRGELVGINTWIYSQSGGDQGIGFAIPSNIARRVSEEIIRTGEVKRGTIGEIQLASVDAGAGPGSRPDRHEGRPGLEHVPDGVRLPGGAPPGRRDRGRRRQADRDAARVPAGARRAAHRPGDDARHPPRRRQARDQGAGRAAAGADAGVAIAPAVRLHRGPRAAPAARPAPPNSSRTLKGRLARARERERNVNVQVEQQQARARGDRGVIARPRKMVPAGAVS